MKRSEAGSGKGAPQEPPVAKAKKKGRSGKAGIDRVMRTKGGVTVKGLGGSRSQSQHDKMYERHSGRIVVKGYFDRITGLSTVTHAPAYGVDSGAKPTAETAREAVDVVVVGKHIFRLKTSALKHLHNFTEEEIHSLVVPKRTLARRVAEKEPLTVEETDKAVRLARIDKLAADVFGDTAKAHRWLRKPKGSLGGETPLAYLATEAGARAVEEMLNQIDHGIIS
jgi:putative toxin-antitoxin system antitoxin component (TIGR02293 family)